MSTIRFSSELGIGRIKSGYCWQYLEYNNSKDLIVCALKKPGDLLFFSYSQFGINNEVYVVGGGGCDIEWNFEIAPESNQQYAQLEKQLIVTALQIKNNVYYKSKNKPFSNTDAKIAQIIEIVRKDSPVTDELTRRGVSESISAEFDIFVPKSILPLIFGAKYDPNNAIQLHDADQQSRSDLLPQRVSLRDSSYLATGLHNYLGDNYSYSLIFESVDSCCADQEGNNEYNLVACLKSINIPLIKAEITNINRYLRDNSPDDFYILFKSGRLVWAGIAKNFDPKLFNVNSSLYYLRSRSFTEISFASFWKELRRSPFSLALIFILSLIIQLLTVGVPLLFQQIIDKVVSQQNPPLLPILVGLMITFSLLAGIFRASRQLIVFDIADRADERFSEIVLRKLIDVKYTFFAFSKQGDIASRVQDVSNIRQFFTGPLISTALDIVFAVLYLAILLLYSPFLTLVSFSPMPIYMALVVWGAPFYKKLVRERASKRAYLFSFVLEVIAGIQSVKLQGFGNKALSMWRDKFLSQQEVSLRLTSFAAIYSEIGAFCTQLSGILILFFGVSLVLQGKLTLGELIAFRIISNFLTAPLLRLSSLWQSYQETQISMERVNKIVQYQTENSSPYDFLDLNSRTVAARNLDFSYTKSKKVLNSVSFNIESGQKVAIVGRSGSGKSTLLKLMTLLYEPARGEILIDSQNIENLSAKALRSSMYCVPQDSHFIGGTVEDNLRYGWLQSSEEELEQILRDVCMEEILETPRKLNMPLQEGGSNLSGGQRQRLAIGRMLLRKPPIVLLDEATSALDSITESRILDTISERLPHSTVVFITHRIHTASKADKILVLEDGYLIGKGTYDQLMKSCEVFRDMVSRGVNE